MQFKTDSIKKFIFGTHNFGTVKCRDDAMCHTLLEQYIEGGGNVIDTARAYAAGESEKYIGRWLRKNPMLRERFILCTKGGQRAVTGSLGISLHEKDVYEDLMTSLEALQTDYIDVYFLHKDDVSVPAEQVIEMLHQFKQQGFIRHIGVSNWCAQRINQANTYAKKNGLSPIEVSQIAFSPYKGTLGDWGAKEKCLEMTADEFKMYQDNKIPVMAYNSQAFGFFYKNFNVPDNEIRASEQNLRKLHILRSICEKRGITPQQAVFGFFAGLDITALPVATTTNTAHLQEMLKSCDTVLDKNEVEALNFNER